MLFSIDVGSIEDLNSIVRINKKIFKGAKSEEIVLKEHYLDLLSKKRHLILLVKESNRIVGSSIAIERNKNYHVWVLGVSQNVLKRGVGEKIIDYNIKLAKKGAFKAITFSVYEGQSEIADILEKKGFVVYRKNKQKGFLDYKLEI
jgi:GNAT superfamily N-acetyltransferase